MARVSNFFDLTVDDAPKRDDRIHAIEQGISVIDLTKDDRSDNAAPVVVHKPNNTSIPVPVFTLPHARAGFGLPSRRSNAHDNRWEPFRIQDPRRRTIAYTPRTPSFSRTTSHNGRPVCSPISDTNPVHDEAEEIRADMQDAQVAENEQHYLEMRPNNQGELVEVQQPVARNRFGQTHLKLVRFPENLDCLMEKFRRSRKVSDIMKGEISTHGWDTIPHHTQNGVKIESEKSPDLELTDGTYLRVRVIKKNPRTGAVVLQGWTFHPTASLRPTLPPMVDEVCWVLEVNNELRQDIKVECMINMAASKVVRERRIILTNEPDYRTYVPKDHQITKTGLLRCRWKFVAMYENTSNGRERLTTEFVLQRIMEDEVDKDASGRMKNKDIRAMWRGSPPPRLDGKYTFVDGFCGAGCASSGARQAGLKIVRCFDIDENAMNSYNLNFQQDAVDQYRVGVHEYCVRPELEPADISHNSTCCQTFSAAHTTRGRFDEANEAASLCIESLLEADKPRVTTFENTSGLWTHHADIMYPLLGQYTAKGYSIRFKLLNFADWGLPQHRRRLILIGSCPGENLPQFPVKTHRPMNSARNNGLKPYVGLGRAIAALDTAVQIGIRIPDHDPGNMPACTAPPYSPDVQARAVTCNGSNDHHPSGERNLTIRELAVLQGFELGHRFAYTGGKTAQKRQIGNAFPALFNRHLYRTIKRQMQQADRSVIVGENDVFDRLDQGIIYESRGGTWAYFVGNCPITIIATGT